MEDPRYTEENRKKAWLARWVKNHTCKTQECKNPRAFGSSRCTECSAKHRPLINGDISII